MYAMNRDFSDEEHRANPPGFTIGSDGRNAISPGSSPGDKESGPDFIMEVKVESEFIDDYSSLVEDEAPLVKMETFQSNFLQASQNALSNEHVKQEPCDSPSAEPSKTDQTTLKVKQMKPVSCSNCSKLFYSEVFNPHITRTNCRETDEFSSASYNHSCKSCAETFNNIQLSERPHRCSVCDKSFATLSSLKVHQKIHTGQRTCSYLLGNQGAHSYNGKRFFCNMCGKTYKSGVNFQRHSCLYCEKCSTSFTRRENLNKHNCLKQSFKCDKCFKIYAGEKTLASHKCTFCVLCQKKLSTFQRKVSHICSHNCLKQSFKCDKCFKIYAGEIFLASHKCTFCVLCQKKFSTFQRKVSHICSKKSLEISERHTKSSRNTEPENLENAEHETKNLKNTDHDRKLFGKTEHERKSMGNTDNEQLKEKQPVKKSWNDQSFKGKISTSNSLCTQQTDCSITQVSFEPFKFSVV